MMDLLPAKEIEGEVSVDIPVDKLSENDIKELKIIGINLIKFCRSRGGMALSACQVGMFKSMFVWRKTDGNWELVINPKYFIGKKPVIMLEGCLSYPGKQFRIRRYNNRWVSYYLIDKNNKIKRRSRELKGIMSIVFQHECDHVNKGLTIAMIGQEVK